ncbi:DUF3102 domain-containing protein [Desulfitobacterium chlororespirans]|uniref:Protein export cytoplasm protein SecA ATPase RNA helicase n=1 Tax=Desulfitobacterium chlororespirans DSM 11544 TaxID=1121395 RepID=A0A1M7TIM0_9FIRM|nr:DUF3102 domain-containing protein [Desulfitobacterium chlororespirans]SHN70567.1 Protein of unknown function [Desulfitobacterium chlororespirans DSM 11544]
MNVPLTDKRTPLVIAAEINAINQESRRMLLKNAIEVGRRLKEAKELLNHGEWMKWLKESVSYSKSTAANLMSLYEEYGYLLLNPSDDDSNFQALGNLTYTQAVLLLGLPEEEREEFVTRNDLGTMTTRQLNQAVKEQKTPPPAKERPQAETGAVAEAEAESQTQPQSQLPPQTQGDIQIKYITRTVSPRRESTPITAPAPAPSHITNYEEKCTACCQTIADAFQELLTALGQLARLDPRTKEKCSQDAGQLASYMVERLKDWPPVAGTNMKGVQTYSTCEWGG